MKHHYVLAVEVETDDDSRADVYYGLRDKLMALQFTTNDGDVQFPGSVTEVNNAKQQPNKSYLKSWRKSRLFFCTQVLYQGTNHAKNRWHEKIHGTRLALA